MKALSLALALAALTVFGGAPSARADDVDMSKLTCGELIKLGDDDAGVVFFWMHGYFGGLAKDPMLDLKGIESAAKVLGEYCGKNPKTTVMNAIKKLAS